MAAAAAVDAFAERQLLMGEASEPAYEELARRARRMWRPGLEPSAAAWPFPLACAVLFPHTSPPPRTQPQSHPSPLPRVRQLRRPLAAVRLLAEPHERRVPCSRPVHPLLLHSQLLQPRVVRDCEQAHPLPRGGVRLRVLRVRAWPRQLTPPLCVQAHAPRAPDGGRARGAVPRVRAGGLRRLPLGLALWLRRDVRRAPHCLRDCRRAREGWPRLREQPRRVGARAAAPRRGVRRADGDDESRAGRGALPPLRRAGGGAPRAARGPSLAQRRGVLAAAAERRAGEAAPLLLCDDDGRGAEGPPACSRTSRAQGFGPPAAPPPRAGSSRARAAVGSGGCRLPSSCLPPQPASSRRAAVATPCGPNGKGLHGITQTSRRELAARAAEMRLMQAAHQITS